MTQKINEESNKYGILYGVGVGPGDPELMTIKAVRLIRECDMVAIPASGKENVALEIAKKAVPEIEAKEFLELLMPMVRDESKLKSSHDKAAETVISQLIKGKKHCISYTGGPVHILNVYLCA